MTGIWQFDDIDLVEGYLERLFADTKQIMEEDDRTLAVRYELGEIFVVGRWGDGTAEVGETELEITISVEFERPGGASVNTLSEYVGVVNNRLGGDTPGEEDEIDRGPGGVDFTQLQDESIEEGEDEDEEDEDEDIIQRAEVVDFLNDFERTMESASRNINIPPKRFREWFTDDLDVTAVDEFQLDVHMTSRMGITIENTVVNLTERRVIEFDREGTFSPSSPSKTFNRIRLDAFQKEEELQLMEDVEEEGEEEIEPEDIEEDEEEDIVDFPDPDESITIFKEDDKLEIPAGKETLSLDARQPFDFEIEMASPQRDMSVFDIRDTTFPDFAQTEASNIREELFTNTPLVFYGKAIQSSNFGNSEPAGTFPRTGVYIRNRLKYGGITYIYKLYKDLVFYSGLISMVHRAMATQLEGDDLPVGFAGKTATFKAGTYQAFRDFIFVLKQITEDDENPELLDFLSQQQAASRGLETIPDHPSLEGEKAPWLERRQYIDIVDEDAEAWANAFDTLYSEEGDES